MLRKEQLPAISSFPVWPLSAGPQCSSLALWRHLPSWDQLFYPLMAAYWLLLMGVSFALPNGLLYTNNIYKAHNDSDSLDTTLFMEIFLLVIPVIFITALSYGSKGIKLCKKLCAVDETIENTPVQASEKMALVSDAEPQSSVAMETLKYMCHVQAALLKASAASSSFFNFIYHVSSRLSWGLAAGAVALPGTLFANLMLFFSKQAPLNQSNSLAYRFIREAFGSFCATGYMLTNGPLNVNDVFTAIASLEEDEYLSGGAAGVLNALTFYLLVWLCMDNLYNFRNKCKALFDRGSDLVAFVMGEGSFERIKFNRHLLWFVLLMAVSIWGGLVKGDGSGDSLSLFLLKLGAPEELATACDIIFGDILVSLAQMGLFVVSSLNFVDKDKFIKREASPLERARLFSSTGGYNVQDYPESGLRFGTSNQAVLQ